MSITLAVPFRQSLPLIRQALQRAGLETAYEWDAALDLRDSVGPQVADLRCLFVFDPLSLLHHCRSMQPAGALASVTLAAGAAGTTKVTIEGEGRSFKAACHAIASIRQQLPDLRHAA